MTFNYVLSLSKKVGFRARYKRLSKPSPADLKVAIVKYAADNGVTPADVNVGRAVPVGFDPFDTGRAA